MRIRSFFTVAMIMTGAAPPPASASELEPIGSWTLDYGDTACTAARQFGTASHPVIFAIIPSITGDNYDLLINLAKPGPRYAEELSGSVDFGRRSIRSGLLRFGDKATGKTVYRYQISAKQIEQARLATTVTLHTGNGSRFSLALTDMPAILDGLKSCTADLQNYWNMGPSNAGRFSRSAKAATDIRAVFTADDYPRQAISKMQQGSAQYILLIDEKGRIAGCDLVRRSGVPALDAMGCAVMQERAKFAPALDAHGAPMRDTVTTPPITWRIMG